MSEKPQQQVRLSLQAKVILFLWKWLGVWVALGAFVWGYAGFVWLTKERLSDPYLRSRMFIFARLIDATTTPRTPEEFDVILNEVINDNSWTNKIVRMPDHGLRYRLPGGAEQQAITKTLSTISSNKPASYEFTTAIKELRPLLRGIQEDDQSFREKSVWRRMIQKFSINDLRLAGVDFREPEYNMASVQQDAADFLAYRDLFHGRAKQTPAEIELRPWQILRFYDVRRVKLNETIPLAFATLLLACGFFLEMRFSDYSRKWRWRDDDSLRYHEQFEDAAKQRPGNRWVALWEESRNSGPAIVSLFRQKQFWTLLVGLNGLALFMEFFLQDPQQRQEWIINGPVMLGSASALTVLYLTLLDLGKLRINPQLARFSSGFRKKLFRPLLMGTASLFAVGVWGVFYSVFELAGLSGMQMFRAVLQVALCGYALWLVAKLLIGIEGQLTKMRSIENKEVSKDTEERLNNNDGFSLLNTVFPDLDERLVKAAGIGLIPLFSIIQSLL